MASDYYTVYHHTTFKYNAGTKLTGLLYSQNLNLYLPSTKYWDVSAGSSATTGASSNSLNLILGFKGGQIQASGLIATDKAQTDFTVLLNTVDSLTIGGQVYHGSFDNIVIKAYPNYPNVYQGTLVFGVKYKKKETA